MKKKTWLFASLLGFSLLVLAGVSISADKKEGDGNFAGAESCKGCHAKRYASYAKSVHAQKAIKDIAGIEACETCHGSGAEHINNKGGKGTVFAFNKKVAAQEKDAKCLTCHQESKTMIKWNMSKHKTAGVSCADCHISHGTDKKNLKMPETELCLSCHKDIKAQMNKQSHHPIKEGKIACGDCHAPHGDFGPKMIKTGSINELCFKCHADKRGPVLFEHPPVEENCLICHTPHASNHSKLMNKRMPYICQECHDWTQHPGTAYTGASGFVPSTNSFQNKFVARSCLNCHTNIHGTNAVGGRGPKFTR